MQVLANPYIRDFHHLHEIFTKSVWSFMGKNNPNYYRPVMVSGYLVLFQLFGPKAWVFHLANILLNVAVVLALFLVSKTLFRDRSLGTLAAATFAIHPIHSEAVNWIAGVSDLELTLFYLLAFFFFLRLADQPGKHAHAWVIRQMAMALCFVLALLSKEPAATLPVVATLFEHFYRDDRPQTSWRQKFSRYAILWALAGVYFAFRIHFLGTALTSHTDFDLKLGQVLVAAVALIGQYAWKLVWPARLCAYYLFSSHWSVLQPWALTGGLVLLATGFLTRLEWTRNRLPTFAFVWFFGTIAPVLNPRWLAANVFTERYVYLPSVGFCWLVGWGMLAAWRSDTFKPSWRKVCLAGGLGIVATLAVFRIVSRNGDWHDDQTLYSQTLALEPNAYWIRNNFGKVLWDKGDAAGAEREWRKALQVAPGAQMVLGNMGMLDVTLGRYKEASMYLEPAVLLDPADAGAHRNLGISYQALGLTAKAAEQFLTAVHLSPGDSESLQRLSEVYFDESRFSEAKEEAARSLSAKPNLMGYLDLGLAEWRLGHLREAERAFQSAKDFDPSSGRPHFLLALLYETSGRIVEAESEYDAGLKIDPNNEKAKAAFKTLQAQTRKSQSARIR